MPMQKKKKTERLNGFKLYIHSYWSFSSDIKAVKGLTGHNYSIQVLRLPSQLNSGLPSLRRSFPKGKSLPQANPSTVFPYLVVVVDVFVGGEGENSRPAFQ